MRNSKLIRTLAVTLCLSMVMPNVVWAQEDDTKEIEIISNEEAITSFYSAKEEKPIQAVVYMTDVYSVKEAASKDANTVADIKCGETVLVNYPEYDDNGNLWYNVTFVLDLVEYTGFIQRSNLAVADEKLLSWEEEQKGEFGISVAVYEASEDSAEKMIQQFPNTYRKRIRQLLSDHPNWIFVPMNTGLAFDTVVFNETGDISLVPSSYPDIWKDGNYGGGWSYASKAAVEYAIDPRNYLTNDYVFMFEQLTYNESYHTVDAVQKLLNGTFMEGVCPDDGRTYAEIFWGIGEVLSVSPFHLASRVYQEQGQGTSPLISGTYPGYEGYYNFFNIGASGSTTTKVITSGLKKAKSEGWNSRFMSLFGGSKIVAQSYILKGQDTLYLQKFDVDPNYNGLFWHQYMQNILAPRSEGTLIRKAYEDAGVLDKPFVFKIPVYEEMPLEICTAPGEDRIIETDVDRKQVEKYVERMYTIALDRASEEQGLKFWTDGLCSQKYDGAVVADGFFFSKEFKDKKLDDKQFLYKLYKVLMDREPDEGGLNFWLSYLSGGATRKSIFAKFVESPEYTKICESYGIKRGSVLLEDYADKNADITRYVFRCYKKVLDRAAEEDGLEFWCEKIMNKEKTPKDVAEFFVFSEEYVAKETTNEEYVKMLYRMYFDREYDDEGLAYWLEQLETGQKDRKQVFDDFAGSAEFEKILSSFGL